MFMFGLQESSKLNRTNFGVYLEDILISMLYGCLLYTSDAADE